MVEEKEVYIFMNDPVWYLEHGWLQGALLVRECSKVDEEFEETALIVGKATLRIDGDIVRLKAVEYLKNRQQQVRANAEREIQNDEERIQKIQALPAPETLDV